MRIAIDIDNVVLRWQDRWAVLYELWYGKKIPATKLATWNACLDETHFPSMGEFYGWFWEAGGWDDEWYVPGALGAISGLLAERKHTLVLVTSRPALGHLSAIRLANRLGIPVEFRGNTSKHLTKADVWIDDSPEVLGSLVEHGKTCIRFEQPWNKDCTMFTHTAKTWAAVLEILKEIDQ